MSTTEQDIKKLLQKAAIDGTLTQEAVKFVDEVIEKSKTLESTLTKTTQDLSDKIKERDELTKIISQLSKQLQLYKDREVELLKREKAMTTLELTAKHESQRVNDPAIMFDKVFRNIETRRNVFTPVAATPQVADQYGAVSQYGSAAGVEQGEEKTTSD